MHVDDIFYAGTQGHFHNVFLKKCKEKISVSHFELSEPGSSITFLKKMLVQLDNGIRVTPGSDVEKLVESFEEKFGRAKISSVPCDVSIQLEDTSHLLTVEDATHFRSILWSALYLGRDRPDTIFCILLHKRAGKMSKPTLMILMALQHLRNLIGYLKGTGTLGVKLCNPTPGRGKWKVSEEAQWVLETFSDADWATNRSHRRSTSCGVHFLNGKHWYSSPRTQKVISLSSCESELQSIVSSMGDCLFIRRCLEFMLGTKLLQVHFTDSSSDRQLVSRQGVGKVRHLTGKILWAQSKVREGEVLLSPISSSFNISDVGTKPPSKKRLPGSNDGWNRHDTCWEWRTRGRNGTWRTSHQWLKQQKHIQDRQSRFETHCFDGPWADASCSPGRDMQHRWPEGQHLLDLGKPHDVSMCMDGNMFFSVLVLEKAE